MINAEIERCAGIDVGKERIAVCMMVGPLDGDPRVETRQYGTTTAELERLRYWLRREQITHVVMESTGSYWKPIFNVLEGSACVYLANSQEVKNRKGHKTDKKDSWWLAHLLRHAMIRPSFIPPRGIRELRDYTRRRKKLIAEATREKNRVEKILQDANVKLSSAITDIFGVTGQLMLEALLKGDVRPADIAKFAQRRAKQKIPEIKAALKGHRMSDHHRRMIGYSLEHLRFLEQQIQELDDVILEQIQALGLVREWELLQTVPGVKGNTAATVLAEIGPDPNQFPSEKHLGSWAGLCPGNNESAGKRKYCPPSRGNHYVKAALTEVAWGVANKKGCFLKDKFWRLAAKKQHKQPALIAVAHTILTLMYRVLQNGQPYQERGGPKIDEVQRQRAIRHHVRRLGKLGIKVKTQELTPRRARSLS